MLIEQLYSNPLNQRKMKEGKMIKTAQGWVVVNDENITNWYVDDCNELRFSATDDEQYCEVRRDYKKAIACDEVELGLYLLDRHQIEEQINGWSLDKLAIIYENNSYEDCDDSWDLGYKAGKHQGFRDGFSKHAELIKDRVFTLEQMEDIYFHSLHVDHPTKQGDFNKYIQSIQQPKSYNVTWETEIVGSLSAVTTHGIEQPKLTNGFLHIKIVK